MTIEEKAKAYDEALERARNLKEMYPQDAPGYEEIFPELRESEEEQALRIIRKRMRYDPAPISDEDRRIVENWLEKQKPAERSEEDKRILRRIIERLSVDKNISLSEFKEMQTFLDSYRQ